MFKNRIVIVVLSALGIMYDAGIAQADTPKGKSAFGSVVVHAKADFERERIKLKSRYSELLSELNSAYQANFERMRSHYLRELSSAKQDHPSLEKESKIESAMNDLRSAQPSIRRVVQSKAPIDAVAFNGHRYKVFGKGLPFSAAAKRCSQLGGTLVVIDSQEEFLFISSLVDKSDTNCKQYWINATDDLEEDSWRTIDGQSLRYLNWGNGEPSSSENQEHYASINRADGWKYNDSQGVYRSYGFVCEWE